eukprot:52089_1
MAQQQYCNKYNRNNNVSRHTHTGFVINGANSQSKNPTSRAQTQISTRESHQINYQQLLCEQEFMNQQYMQQMNSIHNINNGMMHLNHNQYQNVNYGINN